MVKSKLEFKGHEYSLKQLVELRNQSPLYREGDVADLNTGEIVDISDIDCWKATYISEMLTTEEIDKAIEYKSSKKMKSILNDKYEKGIICKAEMFKLLKLNNEEKLTPNYNYDMGYIIVNLNMVNDSVSAATYGKFNIMLRFLSETHSNRLIYSNGKKLSKKIISEYLSFSTVDGFNKFIKKLTKHNLVREDKFGGIKYLIVNPAYARKNMTIDGTIYKMFKEDLDKCLTKMQIDYLMMLDDSVEIDNMIAMDA